MGRLVVVHGHMRRRNPEQEPKVRQRQRKRDRVHGRDLRDSNMRQGDVPAVVAVERVGRVLGDVQRRSEVALEDVHQRHRRTEGMRRTGDRRRTL